MQPRSVVSSSRRPSGGADVALRRPVGDGYRSISYDELGRHARAIARGLIALGVDAGDAVAILCSTRAEWTLCEAGALCAGAIVVPIYHTNSPEECLHVLAHSGARVVLCEDEAQVAKIRRIAGECPGLERVVVIDGAAEGATLMAELRRQGQAIDREGVERRVAGIEPEEVATIVYTSGTTGPPKGCMLTHELPLRGGDDPRSAGA